MASQIKNKRHSELDREYRHYKEMQSSAQRRFEIVKRESWDFYSDCSESEFHRRQRNEITYYHMCLKEYSQKCKELKRLINEAQKEYTLSNKTK